AYSSAIVQPAPFVESSDGLDKEKRNRNCDIDKVRRTRDEEQATYQIVGLDEADVKKGLISILSPMARALIGKRKGETVVVQSPKGDREYEILSFEFK
ncbi:MAG: GreA/GreB family elongation factor, partial [Bdellovibrionales bacterium]